MILYDLHCGACGQDFEAWFKNAATFDAQHAAKLVQCPICDSHQVGKKLSTPAISTKANQQQTRPKLKDENKPNYEEIRQKLKAFKDHVMEHADNVGTEFAAEARKIHHGEAQERPIVGTAEVEEVKELLEEGVDILPLPELKKKN